jgi:hypothetical protein
MRARLLVVVVAAAIVAGCGSGPKSVGAGPGTPTTAPSVAPTTVGLPGGAGSVATVPIGTRTTTPPTTARSGAKATIVQLTGATPGPVDISVGQTVELTLSGPGMRWSAIMVDPVGLLQPAPAPTPPANGQLAIWTAAGPGTVRITSGEMAACAPGTLCPQFVRLFALTVVIS